MFVQQDVCMLAKFCPAYFPPMGNFHLPSVAQCLSRLSQSICGRHHQPEFPKRHRPLESPSGFGMCMSRGFWVLRCSKNDVAFSHSMLDSKSLATLDPSSLFSTKFCISLLLRTRHTVSKHCVEHNDMLNPAKGPASPHAERGGSPCLEL